MAISHPPISFVIPCLNEERTLSYVLERINETRNSSLQDYRSEVIVSDNGSNDKSVQIALSYGARVVVCQERGYGAALLQGIKSANGEIIIFADADDTYNFCESPKLISKLESGFDLVLGSRLKGNIIKGSMPFLHRYVGTPILNFIINVLYSKNGYRTSDCNSGFRCFFKSKFMDWGVSSTGMEFASEMLVKAMKSSALIADVPVSLLPDHPGRTPHLKTWRDGMRHFLRIFVESPSFFNVAGIVIFSVSLFILLICLAIPQYAHVIGLSIFGIHTMMVSTFGMILGQLIWGSGLFISAKSGEQIKLYSKFINLKEDELFWIITICVIILIIGLGTLITYWAYMGFQNIEIQKQTLFVTTISTNILIFISNLFTSHLLKRT